MPASRFAMGTIAGGRSEKRCKESRQKQTCMTQRRSEVRRTGRGIRDSLPAKRKGSPYRSGRSPDWLKMKNPDAPAVKREAEEDWGKEK
jgi:ATP-dependent DNA ligase